MDNGVKAKGQFHTASIDNGGVVIKNFSTLNGKEEEAPTRVMEVSNFVYILATDVEDPPLLNAKSTRIGQDFKFILSRGRFQDRC